MIKITNLTKNFGTQFLFNDASVTIGDNEKIGLIGRNGSGKSTLLKIIQHLDNLDCEIETSNQIRIVSLEQNLNFEYPTLVAQVASAIPSDNDADRWKAESILLGLGFSTSDFSRNPTEFSSGFQIRIRLAQALVADSDLLLLDEPTNYLDIVSLRRLASFLQNWKKGFILVTHDREFMEKVVNFVIGIHRNKLRKMSGGPQKLLDQIKLEEQVYQKTRENQLKKIAKTEDFIRKFRAGARSAGLVQSRIKAIEKQDIGEALENIPEIKFKFHYKEYQGNHLIKVEDVSFAYPNQSNLIENLSFDTTPGDKIAIIGKNGRGKSTLLKLLTGTHHPTSGKIKVNPSLKVGHFRQDSKNDLDPNSSILEEFVKIPGITEQDARKISAVLLFQDEAIKKRIQVLSGGEKSRICLGKAILQTNQILILDEPTNHLDLESAQALIKAMQDYKGLLIFATHDENMIHRVANRLTVFDNDTISVYNESYQYFLDNQGWSEESNLISNTLQKSSQPPINKKKLNTLELRKIQKQQAAIEKKIAKLEQLEIENEQILQQACFDKDHQKIKTYGEKAKQLHDEINQLFTEFDALLKKEEELTQ